MVRWLEIPENYNVIAGDSTKGKTMAHGAGMTKIAGFQKMAEFVHAATIEYIQQNCFFDRKLTVEWEAKQCQSRWSSIFKRYRAIWI
ncbi:hypothetical protein PF010_g18193 [Phytophthora fragariae]|uniref:Uncharacterized protein n=1 Tax=Phytophthora fragariae TaxID=53985 RepID=A0A6A3E8R5_9STRA|nr:hypothetical protein PF009_g19693 [Phytophthora fragariae]KAE9091424.1 hypothetical protein PF010_g18193 [Phytophthora fragariae]KAE9205086.1 hypothetical protein PF004_g17660 [Phytophthora fragariae]KAE9353914.1 hypothetical protein PF008_g4757 [Phytophthora fragariae]